MLVPQWWSRLPHVLRQLPAPLHRWEDQALAGSGSAVSGFPWGQLAGGHRDFCCLFQSYRNPQLSLNEGLTFKREEGIVESKIGWMGRSGGPCCP